MQVRWLSLLLMFTILGPALPTIAWAEDVDDADVVPEEPLELPEELQIHHGSAGSTGPIDLLGELQVTLKDGPLLLGYWDAESEVVLEEPLILAVNGLPTGPAFLIEDDPAVGSWLFILNSATTLPIAWSTTEAAHEFRAGTQAVQVRYKPVAGPPTDVNDDTGEKVGTVTMTPICRKNKRTGCTFTFDDTKGVGGANRNWVQFMQIQVYWEGVDAGGNSAGGQMPFPVLPTGNGNALTGSNYCESDGSTEYVDSTNPDTPNYENGNMPGIGGDNADSTVASDEPNLPQGTAQAIADFTKNGHAPSGVPPLPAGTTIHRIIWIYDFTTYLEVCGKVVYRYDWSFYQVVSVNGQPAHPLGDGQVNGPLPAGQGPPGPDPIGNPETGYDTDHQAALDKYNGQGPGRFSGAPSNNPR